MTFQVDDPIFLFISDQIGLVFFDIFAPDDLDPELIFVDKDYPSKTNEEAWFIYLIHLFPNPPDPTYWIPI